MEGVVNEFVAVAKAVPPLGAAYQSITEPAAVVAPSVTVPVPQRDAGVVVSTDGTAFTVAVVVPAALVQPLTVTVTEYVPVAAVVAAGMEGFCREELKLFGPVHEYVAAATAAVDKFNAAPAQIGPLLVGAGVAGIALTVAVVVPAALVHPFTVAVTE